MHPLGHFLRGADPAHLRAVPVMSRIEQGAPAAMTSSWCVRLLPALMAQAGRRRCYESLHVHRGRTPPADKVSGEWTSANRSMNRTRRDWFAPATDPTSATSTVCWLEVANGEPHEHQADRAKVKGDPRGFEGGLREPPGARGVQRGTRPGGPLWSRRRRSRQLDGLKSGHRRHR